MRRRRATLFAVLMLILSTSGIGLWLRIQHQKYFRNRQLINALVNGDTMQALKLVNEGADPNTFYTPPPAPSLHQLCNQLLHHSSPPVNHSPTAFMIVCGAHWDDTIHVQPNIPDTPTLVQAMLRQGANINAQDPDRWTPLAFAATDNRTSTVRLLLQHNANVNTTDEQGNTLLMACIMDRTSPDILSLLLDHGAKVNVQNKHGWTPLMMAVESPDAARLLLEHGAMVNMQEEYGMTALVWAINKFILKTKHKSVSHNIHSAEIVIKQLLAYGADPNLPSKNGMTALKLAQQAKCADLVALFKQAGARN